MNELKWQKWYEQLPNRAQAEIKHSLQTLKKYPMFTSEWMDTGLFSLLTLIECIDRYQANCK